MAARRTLQPSQPARPQAAAAVPEAKAAAARSKLPPGLYLVATPIGNLADITLRAIDVLGAVDLIACEDSRVTGRLLKHFAIATPLKPYYDHNAAKARPELLRRLALGERIALVSDAGTPLISDPGYQLVRAALKQGSHVSVVPGASSVTAALSLAGLPTDRFFYAGFLPAKAGPRRGALAGLAAIEASLVLLESPKRLAASLADMAAGLGANRAAAVARELTKLYEEVRRGALGDLARHYAAAGPPKGEIVVVVGPPPAALAASADTIDSALKVALASMSIREAAITVAAATGAPKRQVYARALALGAERGGHGDGQNGD